MNRHNLKFLAVGLFSARSIILDLLGSHGIFCKKKVRFEPQKMTFQVIPKTAKFEDTVLLTGFHGIGYAGYWTIKYLIQKLEAKRVAFVDAESVSPVSSTNQGRLVTPYEFFQTRDLTIFKVEVPPYRGAEIEFYGISQSGLRTQSFER